MPTVPAGTAPIGVIKARTAGPTDEGDATYLRLCPTCHVTATGPAPTPASEQLDPSTWTWTDPAAAAALRTGQLGEILRSYRRAHCLTQEQLAVQLGYDKTYVSMLETGRRRVQDVPTRRHIASVLAVPPHILGVTDASDSDFVAMLEFAESTIRLAEVARRVGRATDAVNELWPLVARLEARAAESHLEGNALAVLGRAWTSLGICLGTVLPEERLSVAAQWTGKGVAAAEQLDDPSGKSWTLAMHGNELRKSGQVSQALAVLERAEITAGRSQRTHSNCDPVAGLALVFLARAAGEAGDGVRFAQTMIACRTLIENDMAEGILDPFTCREVHLRGLLDLGDVRAAAALAEALPATSAPTPQWEVIERITHADVLRTIGDHDQAQQILVKAVDLAAAQRLPHQLQRVMRIAHHGGHGDLLEHTCTAFSTVCSRRILSC